VGGFASDMLETSCEMNEVSCEMEAVMTGSELLGWGKSDEGPRGYVTEGCLALDV